MTQGDITLTPNNITNDDDKLFFAAEDSAKESSYKLSQKWHVLIVDDDKNVHQITQLVLKDFSFSDRSMILYHAYSAEEAKQILSSHHNICLIFLDVVMEKDNAGLELVEYIRDTLKNRLIRIILRTGQPGVAPEKKLILNYDINDYKLKTELTAEKLYLSTVTALRSYLDLENLEASRRSLEKMVQSTAIFLKYYSINEFQVQIIKQLISMADNHYDEQNSTALIALEVNGTFMIENQTPNLETFNAMSIIDVLDADSYDLLIKAQKLNNSAVYDENKLVYLFDSSLGYKKLIFISKPRPFSSIEKELFEIFLANVCLAFDSISMGKEIESTQREMIYKLGEIAEIRSKETSYHVKRVAEYSELLAKKFGLAEKQCEMLKMASPLHDIGKIAVPDDILNKPGKLTPEEFDIMKTHVTIGHEMLVNSKGPLMKAAGVIALEHHEKFDGSGYPRGLKGNDIHVFARIIAIADVFDALSTKRAYKEIWTMDNIIELLKSESGKHFDPELIDTFIRNINFIIEIKETLPD